MKKWTKKQRIRSMISCVLSAVMLTTGVPGIVFGSDAEVQDEDEVYVLEEELSSSPELQVSDAAISEAGVNIAEEDAAADVTADVLSDGSDIAAAFPSIETEKITSSGMKIQVSVPEDVFPEGTIIEAADVPESELEVLTGRIQEDLDGQLVGQIVKVLAVDIAFNKDDISLVPGADVKVTMVPGDEARAELREKEDEGLTLSLVYMPAEGKAAVVADEKILERTVEGITFETALFPRYALVATVAVNEETEEAGEEPAETTTEETTEEAADDLTDGTDEETAEAAEETAETERVTSVKVEGIRNSFYTSFIAELSGATVTASVPYYYVSAGTTMEVSFADAAEYESVIAKANYGKEITDLKTVNVSFADRRGRKTLLFGVSLSIELEDTGAEKYVLYEPYRGWYGTELYQLNTSRSPKFNLYSYTDTYVLAGLKADGIARAAGTTKRGRTSFGLNTGNASISAVAERNAFNGSVSMEAVPVDANAIADVVSGVLPEGTTVESIQAFDISFHNSNDGEEVEPRRDVAVTIALPLDENAEYRLVHVADNGEAEIVDNAAFSTVGVSFAASAFSIYVVVEVAEDGSLDFEKAFGESRVTVHAEKGAFEKGTEMVLQSTAPDDLLKIVSALGSDNTYRFNAIDISFYKDGIEVEPTIPVEVIWESVRIEADDEQLIHLKDDGTVEKMTDAVISEGRVEFTAMSFSNYTTTRLDSMDLENNHQIVFNPSTLSADSMLSGDIEETHPEFSGYTFVNATYQRATDSEPSSDLITYLGAFIYREFDDNDQQIGQDKTYIYYKTVSTANDSDLIVKLADDETIHLNYERTPFKITYKVVYNGTTYVVGQDTLPAELADLVFTGPVSVSENTTYEQAVQVELPRGYSSTLRMSNRNGTIAPALGEGSEPSYQCTDNWTVTPNNYPFTIKGTYSIENVTSDLEVTLNVTKRSSYRFTAQPAFNTAYFGSTSTARYQQVNPAATYTFTENSTVFSFITRNSTGIEWAMDSLNINKESILVPFVDNSTRTATTTTTLTSGTIIAVTARYLASGNYSGNRQYTISVSNCYENISITGGNLHNITDKPEWVLQERENLSEFDYGSSNYLPLVAGEPMSYDGWQNYANNNARWTAWRNGTMVFTPKVIRFKVAEGYVNPQIKYVTPEGRDDYTRVGDVTLASAASDFYHLITSEPAADGYYYFSLKGNSSSTYMGLLSARAELARYGAGYDPGTVADAIMPAFDEGGRYGDGSLQGYNIVDNSYVVVAKSAPVDNSDSYIFMYYTIEGDSSATQYAPSQKIPLSSISQYGVYDSTKKEYVIPFVAHWQQKTASTPVNMTADIYLDDELERTVTTVVPKNSSIYVDIDSETMVEVMEHYNWQLFYDEVGSDPFIQSIDETNNHVVLRLYSKFYVYNSGTDTLELHTTKEVEDDDNGTLKIREKDFSEYHEAGYLYGGYYLGYSEEAVVQEAADDNNDHGTLTTADITALSNGERVVIGTDVVGQSYTPGTKGSWDWDDAQTVKKQTPVRAQVYYIKEVPETYLDNYYHGTYVKTGDMKLTSLYLISAIDDCNYNDTGYELTLTDAQGNKQTATVSSSLKFKDTSTGTINTLTPDSVFSEKGYLTYWNASGSYFKADTSYTVQPYWETPDGETVRGTSIRTITIGDLTLSGISHSEKAAVQQGE